MRNSRKILLSLVALGGAAGIAGLGTFATFTSTTSATQSATAGTVVVALGAPGAATNRLTVGANGLVAGDTVQRSVDLLNTGNQNFASVALTTNATASSLLDTNTTDGLQMVIDKCSAAWTETGTSAPFTYTCSGSVSSVVSSVPVVGTNLALANLSGSLTAGGVDHLRVTLTLPSTAGNTFQALSSTISYSFTATQRAATNQ